MQIVTYFTEQIERGVAFSLKMGNESLHETNNGNGILVISFGTPRYLIVNNPVYSCHSSKCTETYPDAKSESQIEHVLVERKKMIF
jgi:hypothetical protein